MVARIKELDALRGIAALFVVFFHYSMGKPEANLGFKLGVTGVDLFFIISGFVIFLSIQKVSSGLEFVVNRFSRLYPTYWACVTFTFILILINSKSLSEAFDAQIIQYIGNMTMFQFYLKIGNLDGPYWTMIIEMIFYIFILFLYFFKKLNYLNFLGFTISVIFVIFTSFFNSSIISAIF